MARTTPLQQILYKIENLQYLQRVWLSHGVGCRAVHLHLIHSAYSRNRHLLKRDRAQGSAVAPSPHLQKMAQSVRSLTLDFRWTQETGVRGTSSRRNLRWLYTVIVPRYNIFLCISDASQSDRDKSKLEYCGATWLQKRIAMSPATTRQQRDP